MNTQQTEEIAEKLYNQTMRDIEYGDTRDNPQWKEAVRRGFMAYTTEALTRQREEIIKEVKSILTDEIAIAHTSESGKTSRLTSAYSRVNALIRKLKEV